MLKTLEVRGVLPRKGILPIDGNVWHCLSPVGQQNGDICFVYLFSSSQGYAYINGQTFPLTDNPVYHAYPYKVILTSYIWLIEQITYDGGIKVHRYERDGQLLDSFMLGTARSMFNDVVLLNDGRLAITYFEKPLTDITDIEIGFSFGNENGWTHTSAIMPGSHSRQNKAALCQHADGSLWCFQTSDSKGVLKAMKLVNDTVVGIWPEFIPYTSPLRPEGEMPRIRTILDGGNILVAYPNKDSQIFQSSPFIKGTYMNVISIAIDGSISLKATMPKYIERVSNFCLGLKEGKFWIAYGQLYPETLKFNNLWIYHEGGAEEYLGTLKYMTYPQQGLTNSDGMVIATMDDGYIHFYGVQGA